MRIIEVKEYVTTVTFGMSLGKSLWSGSRFVSVALITVIAVAITFLKKSNLVMN